MMRIIVQPDKNLALYSNRLSELSQGDAHKALARAVNRVTNTVHGRVIRAIRKQSDIPTAIIRKQVSRKLTSTKAGPLEGVISATGRPVSLKHFKARQFGSGVKAKWGGKWRQYEGAFMGPRPGVIAHKLGGHVFARTMSQTWVNGKRTPIAMQLGPSVPEELVKGESERIFNETVRTMLPARVSHELGRMLK